MPRPGRWAPHSTNARAAAVLARLEDAGVPGTERARESIEVALASILASQWPEIADRFSWLTNTGFPLEFAWTSRDRAIRWTAEVGPPEVPNHLRLDLVCGDSPEMRRRIGALQATTRLRFGAWQGVRHRPDGDEVKVYAELPELRLDVAASELALPLHPVLRTVGLRTRMAGVLAGGGVELYSRSTKLDGPVVRGLEASAFGRTDRLWPLVRCLVGGERLPRPSGVSIVVDPEGAPVALTWFGFAKAMFSDDAATVAALSDLTGSDESRAVLLALGGGAPDGRWRSGMVGVGVAEKGEPWLQLGMRPVA